MDAAIQDAMRAATEGAIEASIEYATEGTMETVIQDATEATEDAMEAAIEYALEVATEDTLEATMRNLIEDAMEAPIEDAMGEGSQDIQVVGVQASLSSADDAHQTIAIRTKDSKSMNAQNIFNLIYQCNVCGKTFNQKRNYQDHVDGHVNGKKHRCETCGRAYIHKHHLISHKKYKCINAPESNKKWCSKVSKMMFECPLCEKRYTRKMNLIDHIRNIHDQQRDKYFCDMCDTSFSKAYGLRRHQLRFCKMTNNISCTTDTQQ